MTQRYFIEIAYNGKRYHGWQVQPNAISVQAVLNDCLSKILRSEIEVVGAGRTDAGVHAKQLFAHFDVEEWIEDVASFLNRVNSFLPNDISAQSLRKVGLEAHCRFDAIARTYEYWITQHKNPFQQENSWLVHKELDVEAMNEAAQELFRFKDFSCFSKSDTQTKTNNCDIQKAIWEHKGDVLVFTIQADRFLRNMVRAIVGTLVEVGIGKITLDKVVKIIESRDRSQAGTSVPAHGLYLIEVAYPSTIWNE